MAPPVVAVAKKAAAAEAHGGRPSTAQLHMAPAASALTDRQLQFWEDVEDGLDDVEALYASKDQNIDRIRAFGRSARGEIPKPVGYAPRHQPSEEHGPDLTAQPCGDTSAQPDLFPCNSQIIFDEFTEKLSVSNSGAGKGSGKGDDDEKGGMFASDDSVWQNSIMGGGWSAILDQRLRVCNPENCALVPETYELLRQLDFPLAVRGVCFARQGLRSGVGEHSDGRNFILTSHLGLVVPEGCWIQVGDERRSWTEGKLTTIDTSFIHSTSNPSDQDRHVLIIGFWHPELTEAERATLEFVYDLRNKYESGQVPVRASRGGWDRSVGARGRKVWGWVDCGDRSRAAVVSVDD